MSLAQVGGHRDRARHAGAEPAGENRVFGDVERQVGGRDADKFGGSSLLARRLLDVARRRDQVRGGVSATVDPPQEEERGLGEELVRRHDQLFHRRSERRSDRTLSRRVPVCR